MTNTNKDLTIVIVTFKSEGKILHCLKSISSDIKVIIIENSKNESFKKKIENQFSNVECIISTENLGYAKGNNLGLSKVKTKYALILNPDAVLDNNALNNFFISINNINNFSIIGPVTQSRENINYNDKSLLEVDKVKGFAMFLNLKEFTEIGFFDENIFIYLEEIDLCKRLKKNNKKIFIDHNIVVNHQGGSSHDPQYNFEMELSRNWHWMWSSFYFTKKHNGFFYALISSSGKLLSSIIKYIFYLITLNSNKKIIYKNRLSGLFNSIIGKPSWYRPNLK
jgi:N-acetylglucosaminyl-diphospho-decaprenol L-rhamnosyltransferase